MSTVHNGYSQRATNNLEIQRVMDQGLQQIETVRKMVFEEAATFYKDYETVWKNVTNESERYKCRLLLDNNQPVGVVFYEGRTTRRYEESGLKDSIRINLIFSRNRNTDLWQAYNRKLLDHVERIAEELKGKSISVKISPETKMKDFFQGEGFKVIEKSSRTIFMGRDLTAPRAPDRRDRSPERRRESDLLPPRQRDNHPPALRNPHDRPPPLRNPGDRRSFGGPPPLRDPTEPRRRSSMPPVPDRGQQPRPTRATIQRKYLNYIMSGQKTIEGRINTGMFARLREGENIEFFCQDVEQLCRITKINRYNSFREMLSAEGYTKCLPDVYNLETACRVYDSIKSYPERAAQHGVLAIHIQRI